jgi:hypothetical protein
METYRGYLESRYLDDFDRWRGEYSAPETLSATLGQ